jgi:hypothetical protein
MIKKYWEFIRERNEVSINSNIFTDEEILGSFQYLTDEGYEFYIHRCIKGDLVEFMESDTPDGFISVDSGNTYHYCYQIKIIPPKVNPSNIDITDELKMSISDVESLGLHLLDRNNPLPKEYAQDILEVDDYHENFKSINDIKLENGDIMNYYSLDGDGNPEWLKELYLTFADLNSREFTAKEIAETFKWTGCEFDDDQIYYDIELSDLADFAVSSSSDYKSILEKGIDYDNYYDSYGYQPDSNSLFQYSLLSENERPFVKAIIKQMGGFEDVIEELGYTVGDEIEEASEEAIIDYILHGRNYTEFDDYDVEIMTDVKQLIGDYEASAHAAENEEEVFESFDRLLEDLGYDYSEKLQKETEVVTYTGKDDNRVRHTHMENRWFYRFYYTDKWLKDSSNDMDDTIGWDISSIFQEYTENFYQGNLNPRLSDYGDADRNDYNSEIKAMIEGVLKD